MFLRVCFVAATLAIAPITYAGHGGNGGHGSPSGGHGPAGNGSPGKNGFR